MFTDLYRNITFLGEGIYDPNSFIGLWIDESAWSDTEYWKLEKALLNINVCYANNEEIPQEVLTGVMNITQFMLVPNWNEFSVYKEHELYTLNTDWGIPDMNDRFERFKYLLGILFSDETSLEHLSFGYNLKST